jgi:hypothetical protein
LELGGQAATRDAEGNFVNFQIAPNMKIYFAQAVANGASIAEKLNGANGGRFCWVSDYAGAYSSADKVYPDGNNYRFNAALLESCTEDSDGDGIVNCADATPVLVSGSLDLSVALISQNGVPAGSEVSWNSSPHAMNYVYFSNPDSATNWQVLTNFVLGPVGGRVSVIDPGVAVGGRFYRVRVEKP